MSEKCSELPDPYFLLSRKVLFEQLDRVRELADYVSYSFKTNEIVGRILEKETDVWFGVHTFGSLEKIEDKSRIWYFAQGWDGSEIDYLLNKGVRSFVVDNKNDLNVLAEHLERKRMPDQKVNLLLRMRLKEHTLQTGKYFVYGMRSEDVEDSIRRFREKSYIDKLGIHVHRKTQNVSEWDLKDELSEVIGDIIEDIDYLNIGGGIPVRYKNYRVEILENVLKQIKETREWVNSKGVKMIVEPGRYLAAPPIKLVAFVKNIYDNNVIINCSVYNTFMDTIVLNLRLLVENELEDGEEGYEYLIKGETPDSYDIFRYRVRLPSKLRRGDKIVFLNAGAYNYHTEFCNLPKLKTVIVDLNR
ncbi:decarboxylase [Candidatus Micrarchaeota archaeon]|nr:decarboxylase [Candidatus Micrarchaeota archaeon]